MTAVKRLAPKALDKYLRKRCSSLSAALMLVGVDQKYLTAETLSTKIVGRIARLWDMTPEQLVTAVEDA